MRFAKLFVCALMLSVLAASTVSAQCDQSTILCVSTDDRLIREVDADTFQVISTFEVPADTVSPTTIVTGLSGIARNPATGQIFVMLETNQPFPLDLPFLAEVDLLSQVAIFIGPMGGIRFQSLTFNDQDQLLAVASDSALVSNAYCEINQLTGSPTDLCGLPNGDDFQGIAFNSSVGDVFHASGTNSVTLEQVTLLSGPGVPCGVSGVGLGGTPLIAGGLRSICYDPLRDAFLWVANNTADTVYTVTAAGGVTEVGNLTFNCSGMAVRVDNVPCPMDQFIRGDADGSGSFGGLLDGLYVLNFQFAGGPQPTCMKAADADGNGVFGGLLDGLYILNFQFAGGPPPMAPFPGCGTDASALTCDVSPAICP